MLIIQRPTVEAVDEEQDNRQRFAVGPLDPGFGHTLGNSLRRTLLSSIPGAAVTQVRFDEALHEFTTLPGVKEDVTDIILNLKDLLVRVHADEAGDPAVRQAGSRRGHRPATCRPTADVEVLNPDLHIATLNAKGRLALDVTVERGRGYVSAEQEQAVVDDRGHPGRLDLLARPPGRPSRSSRSGSSSRPTSTGSCSTSRPTARSRRARPSPRPATPCAPSSASSPTSRRAPGPGAGRDRARRPAGRPTSTCGSRSSTSPSGPGTASSARQINTIGELVERTYDDLLGITNFGQKSLDEVIQRLDERGLSLRTKD